MQGVGECFEEILRRRLDTLSAQKKVTKDSASNDLGVADGSV